MEPTRGPASVRRVIIIGLTFESRLVLARRCHRVQSPMKGRTYTKDEASKGVKSKNQGVFFIIVSGLTLDGWPDINMTARFLKVFAASPSAPRDWRGESGGS